jgi:hypothetical protein
MNETKYYFLGRAAYLRGLASTSLDPQARKPILKAAADCDEQAEQAQRSDETGMRRVAQHAGTGSA